MDPTIREFARNDRDALVALSLRAWEPVFASLERALHGSGVFEALHPDWRVTQRQTVEHACDTDSIPVWVAEVHGSVVGFTAVRLHHAERIGEIYLLAVDTPHQRQGIAATLMAVAMRWMTEQGMTTIMVETGGDPGHAPARATYESAGFTGLPVCRYFKTT